MCRHCRHEFELRTVTQFSPSFGNDLTSIFAIVWGRPYLNFRHHLGPTLVSSSFKFRRGSIANGLGPILPQFSPSFGADLGQFKSQILPKLNCRRFGAVISAVITTQISPSFRAIRGTNFAITSASSMLKPFKIQNHKNV